MHFSVRPGEGGVADWKQPSETPSTSTPPSTQKVDVPKPVEVKPKEIKPIEQPKVQVKTVEPPKAKPFIQPKTAIKKPEYSPGELVQRQLSGMFEEKKDLKLKTSNAKVLQKALAAAKSEITQLNRKLKKCDSEQLNEDTQKAWQNVFGKSTFSKHHDTVRKASEKYGVPFNVVAGIMAHETGKGTSKAWNTKNNAAGLMDPKTKWTKLKAFNSPEEGIDAAVRTIKKNYDRSKGDLKAMGSIYAPIGAKNDPKGLNKHWHSGVSTYSSMFKEPAKTQIAQADVDKGKKIYDKPVGPTQPKIDTPSKVAQALSKQTPTYGPPKPPEVKVASAQPKTYGPPKPPEVKVASVEPKKTTPVSEQLSGFLAHVPRQYLDKFPDVKKHTDQAAQYYRERTRKAETARHYQPDKYVTGKKEEEPKPKG